jgi:hypothetical protein
MRHMRIRVTYYLSYICETIQSDRDNLAVDGVSSEPLSEPNSLLTGKFTGNFTLFGLEICRTLSLQR